MATGVEAEEAAEADTLSQDPLEYCPICHQRFIEPKMLDCLHSYCLKCLEDRVLDNKHRNAVNVQCPVCKQNTVLPKQGIKGLVECSSLASLVLEDEDAAWRSNAICEACDLGQEAVSWCTDCEDYLCEACQEAHQRMLKMRSHKVLALNDAILPASGEVPQCGNHFGQEMTFFCETCQVLICAACTVVAHSHPEHNYVSIEEAELSFKKEVNTLFTKVETTHLEQRAIRDSTQHSRDRLEAMIAKTKEKVARKANEYHAYIQQQEKLLQDTLDQVKHKRAVEIDISLTNQNQSLTDTELRLNTVKTFLAKASSYELLNKKQTILTGIQGIKVVHYQDHGLLHKLSFIDFRPGNPPSMEPFGILLMEEKWKLKREYSPFRMARGVATNSHGHISVVDSESNCLITITDLTAREQRKNSLEKQTGNLRQPFEICINSMDQLVVIDSPQVKVFDKDSKYLFQFTPSRGDGEEESKSVISALAVDADDQIAVGDRGRGVITLHTPEGTLIRTLPSPAIENQLAASPNTSDRLIYSSYEDNMLTSVDYKGNVVFLINTLSKANFRNPTGICCTWTGDILVAGHLDEKEQSGIYYFNPVGEYLQCIAIGLCNPLSMALMPSGNLVVADKLTVKIYQYT